MFSRKSLSDAATFAGSTCLYRKEERGFLVWQRIIGEPLCHLGRDGLSSDYTLADLLKQLFTHQLPNGLLLGISG